MCVYPTRGARVSESKEKSWVSRRISRDFGYTVLGVWEGRIGVFVAVGGGFSDGHERRIGETTSTGTQGDSRTYVTEGTLSCWVSPFRFRFDCPDWTKTEHSHRTDPIRSDPIYRRHCRRLLLPSLPINKSTYLLLAVPRHTFAPIDCETTQ
jgi:hypothetical protein